MDSTLNSLFTYIYRTNFWRGRESRSGEGSGLAQTVVIRRELPKMIAALGIESVLDAGCGDFHWLSRVNLAGATYVGVDIVEDCIKHCARYENERRKFLCSDVVNDPLPKADLIICRDVLVHLSYENCRKALANFKASGAKYLLTTTFPKHANRDLEGDLIWRPLNLEQAPFNFPKPLRFLQEAWIEATSDAFDDYRLCLWRLADIKGET